MDLNRGACPSRIAHDCGAGFLIGFVGSTLFFSVRYARKEKWKHQGLRRPARWMFRRSRKRIMRISALFGRWTFLFSFWDCTFMNARGVDDIINPIIAGGFVGLSNYIIRRSRLHWFPSPRRYSRTRMFVGSRVNRKFHRGHKRKMIFGIVFLTVIEGLSTGFQYWMRKGDEALYVYEPWGEPPVDDIEEEMEDEKEG